MSEIITLHDMQCSLKNRYTTAGMGPEILLPFSERPAIGRHNIIITVYNE